MSFSTPYTFTALELLTAAKMNAIQDNISAIWVGTTAGDTDYYTSATAKQRVAIGGAGALQIVSGAAPAWLAIGALGSVLGSSGSAPRWVDGTRYTQINLNSDVALTVADRQGWFLVPPGLSGWDITHVAAFRRAGGTGVPAFQLRNETAAVDMLTTKVTIDSGENWSGTAATPPVIDTSNDDVATGEILVVDVDVAGTNTFDSGFIIGFKPPA